MNVGRNAGNRIEIEKAELNFIKPNFLFTEIEKKSEIGIIIKR